MDSSDWGNPTLLKISEDFSEHSGAKTYMNWFDGWSVIQYKEDFDSWDYYKKDKGIGEEFKRIEDKDLKLMQLKLPQDLKGVLNLEQHWNEG